MEQLAGQSLQMEKMMTDLILTGNQDGATVSTMDLLAMVNGARSEHGEPELRRNVFHARIEDELDGEHYKKIVVQNLNGTHSTAFELSLDQCMLVSMRESKGVRRKVLEALKAMEKPKEPAWIASLSPQARIAIADLNQQVEQQQKAIEAAQPAIRFLDKFVESKSTKSLREVAKVLGVKERQFIARLEDDGILFRQSGNLLPIAHYHHKGYFEVKTGEANGHAYQQTRFTPDGIAWIAKRFGLTTQEAA